MTTQMTKEAAAQELYDNVHVPVFQERLRTHWGIQPANNDELRLMLKTAASLAVLDEQDRLTQQQAGTSFLQKAAALVDQQLQQVCPQAVDPLPQLIRQSAKAAAANPALAEAARAISQA